MAAKTFTDHRALVLSYELREAMLGIINPGIYCGFDTLAKTSTGFTISHEKTGILKTLENWEVSAPTGVYMNKYGTLVHEEQPINVNVPGETKEGLYILVAYYQRPYVGTTLPVRFEITYTLRAAENSDDLSKLNQYDTPLMTIRISGTGAARTYQMGAVPGSADMKSSSKLSLDDVESAGVRGGLGKFAELGSILKYLDNWLKEKDRVDLNMLAKLGIPNYTGAEEPANPGELPKTYNFINAVYTMWYNLYIIDDQLKKLWNKLGFPEKQPEGETVLDTLKTVWENFVALKKYLNDKDTKIWNRIGYPDKDPNNINWISISKTIWQNLLSLDTELKRYEVQTDADLKDIHDYIDGPLAQDLSTIYSTMGYKLNGNQTEPAMTSVAKTKSIWTNLVDLQNELQTKYDDLNQSNDFKVYMPTLNLPASPSSAALPAADVYKAMIIDLSNMVWSSGATTAKSGNVTLPTDTRNDHNQVIIITFGATEGGAKVDGRNIRVSALRSGDQTVSLPIYVNGYILASKQKGEGFWRVHSWNKGSVPSANVTPGLMAGFELVDGNKISGYNLNTRTQYITLDHTVGLSVLDFEPIYQAARNNFGWSGNIDNWDQMYGRHRATFNLEAPTEEMEGFEKVIKIIGNQNLYTEGDALPRQDSWCKMLWHVALPTTITDPALTFNGIDHKGNGPHRPYLKYPGDWIRIKAMNYEGNGMTWVLIDHGFANPIQLIWNNCMMNKGNDGGLGFQTYNILKHKQGGEAGGADYQVINTYIAYKWGEGDGMGIWVKDDQLHINLSLQCWGKKSASAEYWLNPCIPPVAGSSYLQFCDSRGGSGYNWQVVGYPYLVGGVSRNVVVVRDFDNGVFAFSGVLPLRMGAGTFDGDIYMKYNAPD